MEREVKALFSDGTKEYRYPTEPKAGDTVRLRFRALKDSVNGVWICIDGTRKEMIPEKEESNFVYYSIEYLLGDAAVSYYFKVDLKQGHFTGRRRYQNAAVFFNNCRCAECIPEYILCHSL